MTLEELLHELKSLPTEEQRQVEEFVVFLKERYKKSQSNRLSKQIALTEEAFVGMWKTREDIQDSTEWVQNLRKNEWVN